MTDPRDLEASLADMHRKLRELQTELARLSEAPETPPAPEPEPAVSAEARALEEATARVSELRRRIDELVDLRKELDRATQSLQEEHARVTGRQSSR